MTPRRTITDYQAGFEGGQSATLPTTGHPGGQVMPAGIANQAAITAGLRERRNAAPTAPKPTMNIAQVDVSGTAPDTAGW